MRAKELTWSAAQAWTGDLSECDSTDLVLYFGARRALADKARFDELHTIFPKAVIVGCSTGGQIHNDDVVDDEIAALAIHFDATKLKLACEDIAGAEGSYRCGVSIGRALKADDLAGIFILSDGLNVNGSQLVAGIASVVGREISVTGGLAGDGAEFCETLVGANDSPRAAAWLLLVRRDFPARGVRRVRVAQPDHDRNRVPRSGLKQSAQTFRQTACESDEPDRRGRYRAARATRLCRF